MNCFTCNKDCPMKTEKYMDVTPCRVCARGDNMPTPECWQCIRVENECYFVERITDENRVQRLF